MPNRPLTRKAGKGLVWLVVIGMFVQLGVIVYVAVKNGEGRQNLRVAEAKAREDLATAEKKARVRLAKAEKKARRELVQSQRKGCRRSKLDRRDSVDFQRAQSRYIHKVTGAASVKEDVKSAAREARKVFVRTSSSLASRAKIDCKKAFP